MLLVSLKGGLGNQLFQYALGRKLAIANGAKLAFDTSTLDIERASGDTYRPFALEGFKIATRAATPETIRGLKYPFGILSKAVRALDSRVLRRQHIGFEPRILQIRDNAYLNGYWQSYKYFEDIRDTLLAELELKEWSPDAALLRKRMRDTESAAVHIRRGDFISNAASHKMQGTCSPAYYARAIAHIEKRVPDATWFVFSDDTEWVGKHIAFPREPVFVSGRGFTDAEELMLIAACKHAIIANSTFSWWGAWLNRNPDKIVVAPRPWSNTGKPPLADIIPPSWTLLPRD
jgi:hypothetical protein